MSCAEVEAVRVLEVGEGGDKYVGEEVLTVDPLPPNIWRMLQQRLVGETVMRAKECGNIANTLLLLLLLPGLSGSSSWERAWL